MAPSSRPSVRGRRIWGKADIRQLLKKKRCAQAFRLAWALIDTAENYGEGRSEELIDHVIAGQRDRVFLVSKVEPDHVTGDGIARACEASLARLGTDYLDLYLLHRRFERPSFPWS
jgi:aryl-alcohol dehydrogenase-like predicted oxidoreductase